LRGQVAFASGQGSDAAPLLLKAAWRLEALDLDLARETYLDAYQAAQIAGHLAGGGDLDEVSRAAPALPPPESRLVVGWLIGGDPDRSAGRQVEVTHGLAVGDGDCVEAQVKLRGQVEWHALGSL
jgi:hypothetical protein